jgi:DNA gyrase subunit B
LRDVNLRGADLRGADLRGADLRDANLCCAELRKKTSDFLKDKKLIKNVKGATKALSTKMADVTNNKIPFSDRELYLVEGDSAGGCHFGDVRVKLVDGTTKSFEELVADFAKGIDHRGWAYDRTNKVPVPFTFFHPRITKHVTEYIEMELADGTVWRGTVDHPWLLTNGTYKAAGQLTPDDEIQEVQP